MMDRARSDSLRDRVTLPRADASPGSALPPPGTVIGGTYRIVAPIGDGAMGVVLRAHDERLDREVAIKLVRAELLDTPERCTMFEREARAMARVRHPNVVEIYAFGEHRGAPYFVMEYVPGPDLEAWASAQSRGGLALDEVVGLMSQVCEGVSAIHAAGTVHRDLKPRNVLVGPDFRVTVADLGLATDVRATDGSALGFGGTPGYMAPEVILADEVPNALASRADVYALGAMTFELLTGRPVFEEESLGKLLRLHATQDPRRVSDVRPDVPPVLDELVARALTREPNDRTPSAETFRAELLRARSSARRSFAGLRVLVVDDDATAREALASLVEELFPGVVVERVARSDAALSWATAHPPTLAIIDLDMPGMNGIELLASLREAESTRDLPVVIATGCGGARDWNVAHGLGASGFLMKPIDASALEKLLGPLLSAAPPASLRRSSSRPR